MFDWISDGVLLLLAGAAYERADRCESTRAYAHWEHIAHVLNSPLAWVSFD